jgi:hypothetical protein
MTTKLLPLSSGTLVPVPVCEVCGEVPNDPEPAITRKINEEYYHFYACDPHVRQARRIGKKFKPPVERWWEHEQTNTRESSQSGH